MSTNGEIRILIVDDDQDDFIITSEYIRHIPGKEYKIDWCPKYIDALQHLASHRYDLFFVDYRLGSKSGVDLLKEAALNNYHEPIILLTGKGNYRVDIEAMQLGAVDYLIKTELSIEKMERCIRYALERSATMKALKTSESKYRSIFEKSKDVIFLTDDSLRFIEVNDAAFVLFGYTKDEMIGMTMNDLFGHAQLKTYLSQILQTRNELNDFEIQIPTKEGEIKTCTLTITLEDSENNYIQGIIHDITNLKKVEKANIQAEKFAAAGRLVRTLAHEVRNPLNNITLSVEQLMQDIKDDATIIYLDIIQRNSKRIGDLINELLSSSKPSEIKLEEYILQTIMDDVINASIDRLTLKKIKLQLSYPEEFLIVKADKEKLMMALLNIVINAVEAMEEGNGNLSITLSSMSDHAVLRISDNGCGISEENISRLFEPYFTQKRNGVGLGLAFTLNILQAHKAIIEVQSIVGQGTTFTITFPLVLVNKGELLEQARN